MSTTLYTGKQQTIYSLTHNQHTKETLCKFACDKYVEKRFIHFSFLNEASVTCLPLI